MDAFAALLDDPAELFAMTPLLRVGEVLQEIIGGAADGGEAPLSFFRRVVERDIPEQWRGGVGHDRTHAACACPRSSPRVGTT